MQKVYVIYNDRKTEAKGHLPQIISTLENTGFTVIMSEKSSLCKEIYSQNECYDACDFIVVIGGDGTILRMAQKAADYNKPTLGINLGTIGFLTELEITELYMLEKLKKGEFEIDVRTLLSVEILDENGSAVYSTRVLNEAVVNKGIESKTIRTTVMVDDEKTAELRGDGVIVATPTGSTAYSLSAGGPVLSPRSVGLVITPICTSPLSTRAFVVSDGSEIIILPALENVQTYMSPDGFTSQKLLKGQCVRIKKAQQTFSLIRLKETSFYERVRLKL